MMTEGTGVAKDRLKVLSTIAGIYSMLILAHHCPKHFTCITSFNPVAALVGGHYNDLILKVVDEP